MGLLMCIYEFTGPTPSTEEVAVAIRHVMTDAVDFSGTLALSRSDDEERRQLHETKSSLRLSSASLKLTLAADRQFHRRRYVTITVSLRGRDLLVVGSHVRLFRSVCGAIESLGGVPEHARRAKQPNYRH